MATNDLDNPGFNFGIQDTMEMGLGSAQLLNDLMESDTVTSEAEGITPIIKQAVQEEQPKTDPPLKGKEVEAPKEGEDPKVKNTIADFMGNHEEEEEETTTGQKISNVTEEQEEEDNSGATKFTALSNDLFKLGVFNKEEDEEDIVIKTPEDFLERFHTEKRKGAIEIVNQFIGQFGEDYQDAFDAIFVKGVDPQEYFGAYNTAVNFAEMDLTIESNQEAIMRKSLSDQGFEKEDIETEIDRLRSYGDLETVSQRNHKVLVKKEAAKMQELEQRAQAELSHKAQIKNQYITNVQGVIQEKLKEKEFDGIPVNPKIAAELQDFLLVDKYKTASGETLTDFDKMILDLKRPENHAKKVKLGLLMKLLEKDPTLSTIQKAGVTKKTDQLFGEVARQVTKEKSPIVTDNNKPKSWFS